jgi:hypothetical protein
MKKVALLLLAIIAISSLIDTSVELINAEYSNTVSIVIRSDGSITPSNAPVVQSGNTYVFTDDVFIPGTTNEGIIIEKDNIVLDGAGHKLRGHGESSAILMEKRSGVTITGFLLDNFYYGLEIWNSTLCTISRNNLTAVMYPIYLKNSSDNKFYHNNIYRYPYYENSNNVWNNGYPSGGNYWNGYPYPDAKSGPNQNLPGSDGIGDTPVAEEIFSAGGTNVDRYPLMSKQTLQAGAITNLKVSVKDATGKAVSGANIGSIVQPSGQAALEGTSGTDGVESFSNVLPGSYSVQASKSGFVSASSSVNVVKETTTDVTIILQIISTTGNLKVIVKDKDGAVIAGASVSSSSQPNSQPQLSGTTGADGVSTFSGVLPGAYALQASKSGYVSGSAQFIVVSGGTGSISINLQAQSFGGGGIPGFPYETIAIGILLFVIWMTLSRKKIDQLQR